MRITREGGLRLLLDAARKQVAAAPSQETFLAMLGLGELAGREGNPGRAAALHEGLVTLIARARVLAPEAVAACGDAIARFDAPPTSGADPALFFVDALGLLEALIGAMGDAASYSDDEIALLAEMAAWEQHVIGMATPPPPEGAGGPAQVDFTADTLAAFLRDTLGAQANVAVESFRPLPGGMSKRAFLATTVADGRGREDMVIKMGGGSKLLPVDCMTIAREFAVLKAAFGAGLMTPEPLWLGRVGEDVAGDFYAMRRSEGSCTTDLLTVTSPVPRDVLLGIAEQLGKLHATKLETIGDFARSFDPRLFDQTASQAVRARLDLWAGFWRDSPRLPSPLEHHLLGWLYRNLPANDAPPSLIHGDCSPHNCLWEGDRLTAVIDWECAHFGDPAEDIAYIRPTIEQRMDWAEWVAHYEASGGPLIAPRTLEYFACYDHFRNVVLTNFYLVDLDGADLRPLAVDAQYAALFANVCMTGIRNFEAMA